MKEFLILGHEDGSRNGTAIDWQSPDEILMEREDEADSESCDLGGISEIPRDALKTILNFLVSPEKAGLSAKKRWEMSLYRLVILAHTTGMQDVGNKSLSKLAEELGVTRSLLSHYAIQLCDQLGQAQPRGGKSRASRQVYRETATESHRRRGHRLKQWSPPQDDDDQEAEDSIDDIEVDDTTSAAATAPAAASTSSTTPTASTSAPTSAPSAAAATTSAAAAPSMSSAPAAPAAPTSAAPATTSTSPASTKTSRRQLEAQARLQALKDHARIQLQAFRLANADL
jgi:hypothetical protein